MGRAKFASITPDLLLRRGRIDRADGLGAGNIAPAAANAPRLQLERLKAAFETGPGSGSTARMHRYSFALPEDEYERLGIVAAKQGRSRREVLRAALDRYLRTAAHENRDCRCLAAKCESE